MTVIIIKKYKKQTTKKQTTKIQQTAKEQHDSKKT